MKKYRGFTFFEVLLCLAIAGILAAIAVPNFLQAKNRERIKKNLDASEAISQKDIQKFEKWSSNQDNAGLARENDVISSLRDVQQKHIMIAYFKIDGKVVRGQFTFDFPDDYSIGENKNGTKTLIIKKGRARNGVLIENSKPIICSYLEVKKG